MGKLNQIVSTIILCVLCFNAGIIFTWPSSTLTLFSSVNTTLHRCMTEGETALLGSLGSAGAMVGTPLAGMLLDRIGRKQCSLAANLVPVVGWAMIAFSSRVEVVLTAIFICGFSSASFIINSVYISEICHESLRGTMTAGIMVSYGFGMLFQYTVGGYLKYLTTVYLNLSISVAAVVLNFTLKESPLYLVNKGLEKEAKAVLAYFIQAKPDSKVVQDEIEKIRRMLNSDIDDDKTPEETQLDAAKGVEKEKLSLWQFLKKSRSTRQAMFVTLFLMTASICQGLPVVQVYAEPLFSEAVPTMSSTVSSIILAVIGVGSGLAAAVLTDAAGRKPLLMYGSIGAGVFALLLGSQIQFSWGPHWLTAVFIYLFSIVYTLGAGTVPNVLSAEVFLPEVKSFFTMLMIEWAWICNFLILFIFHPLVTAIGLGPVFYIFAGICAMTAVFTLVYLPETKGLTVDAIQHKFAPRKISYFDAA